jgi:hypothetical protein
MCIRSAWSDTLAVLRCYHVLSVPVSAKINENQCSLQCPAEEEPQRCCVLQICTPDLLKGGLNGHGDREWVVGQLGPEQIRAYHAYLITGKKLNARHLVEGGADLPTVQALLGHADLKPTSIYFHLSERHLRGAGTPLDNAGLLGLDQVKRSRRLHKK